MGRARCAGPGKAEPRSGRAAGSAAPCLPLIARPSPSGVVARQAREELKAKDANCQSLTEDLVDTATRERSLESQLARLGGVEVQAGAQAEQVEHGKDASATSVAAERTVSFPSMYLIPCSVGIAAVACTVSRKSSMRKFTLYRDG